MAKRALITGVTGQDGAYLSHHLLSLGYEVWGTTRYASWGSRGALETLGIAADVPILPVDFESIPSLACAIQAAAPDEVYNLAAQSSVARSFDEPTQTGEVTGLGAARLLHALRQVKPDARYYQASSSEVFGIAREVPQRETTPFYPRSPYGAAKSYAHWMTINYRESYGIFACNGILFNHESPIRPEQFVTRKITMAAARIKLGFQSELVLGNIEVARDWGFAGDYVEAMHLMLQQDEAEDFIIATGKTHQLRDFIDLAFGCVGLDYRDYIRTDMAFYRPAEVNSVVGDASKAAKKLGWKPRVSFEQLVDFLVEAELKRARGEGEKVDYFLPRALKSP